MEHSSGDAGYLVDTVLPPEPEGLEPLHDREYRVRAYRRDDHSIMIRAALRDQQPPGLYFDDDQAPIVVHHMVVDLDIEFPTFDITRAEVVFESHPHPGCPEIAADYSKLVGLSFRRGFPADLRERLSGPAGCVHVGALLMAVRPAVMQYSWVMSVSAARRADAPIVDRVFPPRPIEGWRKNFDTCHVWAREGALAAAVESGVDVPVPVPLRRRLGERGVDLGRVDLDWGTDRRAPS